MKQKVLSQSDGTDFYFPGCGMCYVYEYPQKHSTSVYLCVCLLQYHTIMVCPGLTTFISARLCRISPSAFSPGDVAAEGSSPPPASCFPSSSSSPRSAPVNLRLTTKKKKNQAKHLTWPLWEASQQIRSRKLYTLQWNQAMSVQGAEWCNQRILVHLYPPSHEK